MKEHVVKTYTFDELSEEAQEKALEKYRDWNVNGFEWWDCVYDDVKAVAEILGIETSNIYFSGFCSQGDGACFEGRYEYAKGSCKKIREYAPKDEELHRIADVLREIQQPHFYTVWASVKHRGHYQHEMCTDITVEWEEGGDVANPYDEICEALRDFMRWIYRRLEQEYDWLTSDEQVAESLQCNEVEFLEDGELF